MFYEIMNQLFELWWYSGCRVVALDARALSPRNPRAHVFFTNCKRYRQLVFVTKIMTFLDKKVRKSGVLCIHSGLFSGIPDFEPRTSGFPDARTRKPEWGLGFRNCGLSSGLSASLACTHSFCTLCSNQLGPLAHTRLWTVFHNYKTIH